MLKALLKSFALTVFYACLFSSAAWANITDFAYANPHGSFYLSADAGIFQGIFNARYYDETDLIAQNIAETSFQNGYTGGLAIGYTKLLSPNYSLGVELSANLVNNNARFESGAATAAFTDTTQINNYYDLVLVPGILLTDSVITYLKLGASLANMTDDLTSPVGFLPTYANYHNTTNRLGFVAGIGIKKYITCRLALFAEYTYHDYNSVDFPNFQNFTATYSHQTDVYSNLFLVGATYNL